MSTRRSFIKAVTLTASLAAMGSVSTFAQAADTIKVGILHSLSGTMAISETALTNVALMTTSPGTRSRSGAASKMSRKTSWGRSSVGG